MSERHGIIETIFDQMVPVHADGHKFVAIGAALTLLFFLLWPPVGWLLALVTAWVIYFFRDPPRVTPLRDGLVVSAADGRVSSIDTVKPPAELGLGLEERVRVSTFLSVFDVHINRAPIAGRIIRSVYIPGAFFNAALDKASEENERRALVIQASGNAQVGAGQVGSAQVGAVEIGVVQIAGLIARRIVTFSNEGDVVGAGQRFGLIRFGSRVDIYLPPGRNALVSTGQRVIGGETVIADLKSDEAEREARRD